MPLTTSEDDNDQRIKVRRSVSYPNCQSLNGPRGKAVSRPLG